jgi:effector-binding domain-containing protein
VRVSEINDHVKKLIEMLQGRKVNKNGPLMSATHGVEIIDNEHLLDVEFLVAIDRKIDVDNPYRFVDDFHLVNALYTRNVGNREEIQLIYNELLQFMSINNMQQLTSVYSVNVNDEKIQDGEEPIIELYVSINPNVV